jgi:hypothetical protein
MPRTKPPAPTRTQGTAYRAFRARHYATPASRGFGSMSLSIRGFGGVVFGNTVRGLDGPRPKTLSYTADGNSGYLTVTFIDGSVGRFSNVSPEEAFVAHKIVYGREGADTEDPADGGIGLVGLSGLDYRDCPRGLERKGQAFDVILHPALGDRDLGWAAVYADALPIGGERMRKAFAVRSASADDPLRAVFEELDQSAGNWKITDVPLAIRRTGSALVVERDAASGAYPEALRRIALIEIRPFAKMAYLFATADAEPGPDMALASELYWNMPAMLRLFDDYRKVNSFAGVLGLFRWASGEGATFSGAIMPPPRVDTPEAILVVGTSIEPIRGFSDAEVAAGEVDRCKASKTAPN